MTAAQKKIEISYGITKQEVRVQRNFGWEIKFSTVGWLGNVGSLHLDSNQVTSRVRSCLGFHR
jgi:hypothetical protein